MAYGFSFSKSVLRRLRFGNPKPLTLYPGMEPSTIAQKASNKGRSDKRPSECPHAFLPFILLPAGALAGFTLYGLRSLAARVVLNFTDLNWT